MMVHLSQGPMGFLIFMAGFAFIGLTVAYGICRICMMVDDHYENTLRERGSTKATWEDEP
jgi:hypothetical protein